MFPVETISAKMLDYYVGRRDTLIIDLREKEFYMHSHVKGAVNMPYGEIDGYTAFPKGKILVLYCDTKNRSGLPAPAGSWAEPARTPPIPAATPCRTGSITSC